MKKKKGIQSISLSRMNNGAHFMFLSLILMRAQTDEHIRAKCEKHIEKLRIAAEKEDADLKISQKSMLTDSITVADEERAMFFRAYKKAVQCFMKVRRFAEDGKVLNQHLKDYSINPKMQKDRETGLITNLITDLETKFTTRVAHLHLTSFVEEMKTSNEEVRNFTIERTEEWMSIPAGSLKSSREASDEAYETLIDAVNVLARSGEETECQPFIDYVNTEVVHYKRQVLRQKAGPAIVVEGGSASAEDANLSSDRDEGEESPVD